MLKKPSWIKVRLPGGKKFKYLKKVLREKKLHTVCEESLCPNIAKCWGAGTATFMLLGNTCTRSCKFCSVKTENSTGKLDITEPTRVAEAVKSLNLAYVVLTSVDRDDLEDAGVSIFAETVQKIKSVNSNVNVEALTPDFYCKDKLIKTVVNSGLDVFAHNIESVECLTPFVRDPKCSYKTSLLVLQKVKKLSRDKKIFTKSSLLLGLGETKDEIYKTMFDLRKINVDILVLCQYLQPTKKNVEVKRYILPTEFNYWKKIGLELGFPQVIAFPFARTSYKAREVFTNLVHPQQ